MIGLQDIAQLSRLPPEHLFRLGIRVGAKRLFSAAGGAGLRSKVALEVTQADLIVGVTGIVAGSATQVVVGVTAAAITGTASGILNMDWQSIDDPQQGARFLPGVQVVTDNTAGAYSNNGGELGVIAAAGDNLSAICPLFLIRKVVGTPIFLDFQPGADNTALDMSIRVMTFRKLRDTELRESLEAYVQPFIGYPPPVIPAAIRERLGR